MNQADFKLLSDVRGAIAHFIETVDGHSHLINAKANLDAYIEQVARPIDPSNPFLAEAETRKTQSFDSKAKS